MLVSSTWKFKSFFAATLIAGGIAAPAFAKVVVNTIDPIATVNGRHVILTGPIRCDEGQTVTIGVTVTQRPTGALAEGQTRLICTGDTQHWEIDAATHGNETFESGTATAVAVGRTTDRGVTDDAQQWLVQVTLAEKGEKTDKPDNTDKPDKPEKPGKPKGR